MERLKKLRQERGFTQGRMGMELNVSQTTISAYETDARAPDSNMILRFAKYFNVSSDYILELSDARQPIAEDSMTEEEMNLVILYRTLNSVDKQKVLAYAQGINER